MSFIDSVKALTKEPARKLLHAVPRDVPSHELGTVDIMDRGGRWVVNGATTAATMLVAAPIVGSAGLVARVATSRRSLPVKVLVVPFALPVGALAGLVSGVLNAAVGTGAVLTGATMVVVGAVAYPVHTVSREISAFGD